MINQNQLRNFGTLIQDKPYNKQPMTLTSSEGNFTACLRSTGTVIHLTTWSPTNKDLMEFPHIHLTSAHPWDPHSIIFPSTTRSHEEEKEDHNISSIDLCDTDCSDSDNEEIFFIHKHFVIESSTVSGYHPQTLKK